MTLISDWIYEYRVFWKIYVFCIHSVQFSRTCVFLKWSKMAIIPFCIFLPVLKKKGAQGNQEQLRSQKPCLNHGRRIKTILGQFRNRHTRYVVDGRGSRSPHIDRKIGLNSCNCGSVLHQRIFLSSICEDITYMANALPRAHGGALNQT
jgi:hypothetical protein